MTEYSVLILPLSVYTLALVSPGQNFFMVCYTAMNYSLRVGVALALGIATGSFIFAVFSIFGYSIVVKHYPNVLLYMQVFGSAFIIYLGFNVMFSKPTQLSKLSSSPPKKRTYFKSYSKGLMTNLSNAKGIVFFTSIFGAYLPKDSSVDLFLVLIGIMTSMSVAWHIALTFFFSNGSVVKHYQSKLRFINLFIGVLLILIGASVIVRLVLS